MGKQWKQCQTLFFGGSKITADGDCSHEIKRRLLLGRKVMTNLDSIFKSRDIILPTKVHLALMFSQRVPHGVPLHPSWSVLPGPGVPRPATSPDTVPWSQRAEKSLSLAFRTFIPHGPGVGRGDSPPGVRLLVAARHQWAGRRLEVGHPAEGLDARAGGLPVGEAAEVAPLHQIHAASVVGLLVENPPGWRAAAGGRVRGRG